MPILGAETQCYPTGLLASLAGVHSSEAAEAADDVFGDPSRRWWVAQTKPRQEKSLARELVSRCVPFYLPQIQKTSVVRGRRRTSFIPLFSGYLFLFGEDSERQAVLTTNRIVRLLEVNDPLELSRQLWQVSRLVDMGAPLTVEARLQPGDRVRVKSGALAGVEGTVLARRRKCRLIVAVELIRQGVSVEIDDHILESIG
jgi:transcriptional antiterminator RfaH